MNAIDHEFIAAFDEEFTPQCERLDELAELLISGSQGAQAVQEAFRVYHTIKGNALSVGLQNLGEFVHQAEEVLRLWRDGGHLPTPALGNMMLRVGDELRRLRSNPDAPPDEQLLSWLNTIQPGQEVSASSTVQPAMPPGAPAGEERPELTVSIDELDRIFQDTENLRSDLLASGDDQRGAQVAQIARRLLGIRTKPVRSLLPRLKRMVRETAAALGREVDFIVSGDGVAADAATVSDLAGALPHLLRNGLDHGIENPEDRRAAAKAATARLELGFRFEGGSFIVRIAEDGRGMDDRAIARSAVSKGILEQREADALTRYERLKLIFRPGFSTAAQLSTVSGRGVGMDAVAAMVDRHGGRIDLETKLGFGTAFELVFPVPYRFDNYLLITLSERALGLPVSMVQGLMVDAPPAVEDGMVEVAGSPLVLLGFREWDPQFGRQLKRPLIILDLGGISAVMAVDRVLGFASALIQGLPANGSAPAFLAGIARVGSTHFWAIDDSKLRQDWNAFTVPME
ncbi:MAG: hypothetical protein EA402_05260 [Planctomycetota bacterium]|nr:MAG: hypothetical protein EA402_05260 [Planctomycetota bacterium]